MRTSTVCNPLDTMIHMMFYGSFFEVTYMPDRFYIPIA